MEERIVLEHLTGGTRFIEAGLDRDTGRHVGHHLVNIGGVGHGDSCEEVVPNRDELLEVLDIVGMRVLQRGRRLHTLQFRDHRRDGRDETLDECRNRDARVAIIWCKRAVDVRERGIGLGIDGQRRPP